MLLSSEYRAPQLGEALLELPAEIAGLTALPDGRVVLVESTRHVPDVVDDARPRISAVRTMRRHARSFLPNQSHNRKVKAKDDKRPITRQPTLIKSRRRNCENVNAPKQPAMG